MMTCDGCGDFMRWHVRNVDGEVICLARKERWNNFTASKDTEPCDCVDGVSPSLEAIRAAAKRNEEIHRQQVEHLLGRKRLGG